MDLPEKLFECEDGIAELIEEAKLYHEAFSIDIGVPLGEFDRTIFRCRVYCGFDGNPVKRNNTRIYTDIVPVSKKYKGLFEKYMRNYPELYERVRKKNTDVTRQVFLQYQTSQQMFVELQTKFELTRNELVENNNTFFWNNFVDVMKKHMPDFDINGFIRYGYSFRKTEGAKEFRLRFDSLNYRVENKTTIFSGILQFNF